MAGKSPISKVLNIPQEVPFIDTLAGKLILLANNSKTRLMDIRVFLPTRHACHTLKSAIFRKKKGESVIFPRLIPLGDIDEDELFTSDWGGLGLDPGKKFDFRPPVEEIRRHLMLAQLVRAKDPRILPDHALKLAIELASLLDQIYTERLEFKELDRLAPIELADHWEVTVEFLKILERSWPQILEEEGVIESVKRRNQLLTTVAENLSTQNPNSYVIAAGSTGTIPATADLLKAIINLPNGHVVLPGLDRQLSDFSWDNMHPAHPQYGIKKLLNYLKVERDKVDDWVQSQEKKISLRSHVINKALGSNDLGNLKEEFQRTEIYHSMKDVSIVPCSNAQEESLVIALAMRHTLESKVRTAALVTPDRRLARRVVAQLKRWNINISDSASRSLNDTSHGIYLKLILDAASKMMSPVSMLALLKHPLSSGGMRYEKFRECVRKIELMGLRGPRPISGVDGLKKTISRIKLDDQNNNERVKNISREDLLHVTLLLEKAFNPLLSILKRRKVTFRDIAKAHITAAEHIAGDHLYKGEVRLWSGDIGEQAASFMFELMVGNGDWNIEPSSYLSIFDTLIKKYIIKQGSDIHPQLSIWGLLEARLQRADTMILGGLNEGTWPPDIKDSPWMSRSMIKAFGLPPIDRRIGLTAHDFVQGMSASNVLITRSLRFDGTPTIKSRWLTRIESFLARLDCTDALAKEDYWLKWAIALDKPKKEYKNIPPAPIPPVKVRPATLTATQIETLIRDPYTIYAEKILNLSPLDNLDADPSAPKRGIFVHLVLEKFIRAYMKDLPKDAEKAFLEIGQNVFAREIDRPGVLAIWWPRLKRVARWYVENERIRRKSGYLPAALEVSGMLELSVEGKCFRIVAKADRIDYAPDSGYTVIDYKTGLLPTDKQIEMGLAPQLPIEAAILSSGGFKNLKIGEVKQMVLMQLSGGKEPGVEHVVELDPLAVASSIVTQIKDLLIYFNDQNTPYRSNPRPTLSNRFKGYDHLARVKAWRIGS